MADEKDKRDYTDNIDRRSVDTKKTDPDEIKAERNTGKDSQKEER